MIEIIDRLSVLLNQLLDIGAEHVELLIACLVIIAAIGVTVTLFCICVVLSIPFMTVYGIVKFILWLYHLRHPVDNEPYWDDEEYDEYEPAGRRIWKAPSPGKGSGRNGSDSKPEELPPVYPDWMNKKSGRLL